jgi:hypothetical protein
MAVNYKKLLRLMLTFGLLLGTAQAFGQDTDEPVLPQSPNGRPMEAVWDYAPQAPDGNLRQTGPYIVSRWGDIVIRGRREGDQVVSALSFVQCGNDNSPAMRVAVIGVPPQNLCDSVTPLAEGQTQSASGENFHLFGQSRGWSLINFAQTVDNNEFRVGEPPVTDLEDNLFGITANGAVYRNENGKHVFFAPGETVDLGHDMTFVVTPAMDPEELRAYVIGAAMRGFSDINLSNAPKKKPPISLSLAALFTASFGFCGATKNPPPTR